MSIQHTYVSFQQYDELRRYKEVSSGHSMYKCPAPCIEGDDWAHTIKRPVKSTWFMSNKTAIYMQYRRSLAQFGTTDIPDSKVHWANMGPTWGRQDPGGPHVGPVNLAIWDWFKCHR